MAAGALFVVGSLLLIRLAHAASSLPGISGYDHHNHPRHAVNGTYDFIIVGGGTSGLVVANRLSEDPNVSVLVVEYGYLDNNGSLLIPYNANFNARQDLYNISSTPLVHLNNKPARVYAAATVGGGSVVNGMFFDRASSLDYDAWEQLGNPGWGWEGLLPYFKKSTNFTPPTPEVAARYNYTWDATAWGTEGPIHASLPPFQWPQEPDFVHAFGDLGDRGIEYPREGSDGSGVGVFWIMSMQDPTSETRSDARTGYYDPVAKRTNLHLVTGTKVDKILFQNKTAIGVQMTSREDDTTVEAYAKKEVILAAGPIFSPNILQLSGIGPRKMLEDAGIEVIHDLPGVGMNFQDHPTAYLTWNFTHNTFPNPQTLKENTTFHDLARSQYLINRTGPYIQAHGNNAAFLNLHSLTPTQASSIIATLASQNTSAYLPPNYDATTRLGYATQHTLLTSHLTSPHAAVFEFPFNGPSSGVVNSLQKPLSRGTITLNTSNPFTSDPVVDYNTLSNPLDALLSIAMLNFTRAYFSTASLAPLSPLEIKPGINSTTNDEILHAMTERGILKPSFAHPCCANAMMPVEMGGVVSSTLEVYGVRGLRVVDSSVIPMIPATHLCATVYAVAEKAADLIKERYGLMGG